MGKIIAIGGGELKDLDTFYIDREIVNKTGKPHPTALFIPTASDDSEGYWSAFQEVYGKKLGCKTQVLYLIKEVLSRKEIKSKILNSDLIYVGGGNTLKMLKLWRGLDVDIYLKEAYKKGIVLSGLSAGAICWFRYGCSDSRRFQNPSNSSFMKVRGLDFVNLTLSPHHIKEKNRDKGLEKLMAATPGIAVALDDSCALEIIDGNYRFIASKSEASAKRVYYLKGELISERLKVSKEYSPIHELIKKR